MSFEAQMQAWELIRSQRINMRPSDRLVLLTLADRSNDHGVCWPSIECISGDTGLDKSTIIGALNRLIEASLIERKKRFGTSPIYRMTITEIQNSENAEYCASIPGNKNSSFSTHSIPESPPPVLRVPGKEPVIEPINKPVSPIHKRPKKKKITMQQYLDECRGAGKQAIQADHGVFKMAAAMKIPDEFVHLCWCSYRDRHLSSGNKQASWPQAFQNAVKGNWEKIWWINPDGEYQLTTAGLQMQIAQRSAA